MHPTIALALAIAQPLTAFQPPRLVKDGPPVDPTGVTEIVSAHGAKIRYKQPGKQGVCQSSVDDYSGYISLDEKTNMFFWFFEARENPNEKPLTLWLNGGPGADALVGLFLENGPCNVTETLEAMENPYSWNEASNMLYLSLPVGVGFSYETTREGTYLDNGTFLNASEYPPEGRYSLFDTKTTNTTQAAAIGAWHVLQAFLELSPQFDSDIVDRTFNLGTESYGGHTGPRFLDYFHEQNERIISGEIPGTALKINSLLIINGIISMLVQAPYYPIFAVNNTYGVKGLPDDVYTDAVNDFYKQGGCKDQLLACSNQTVDERQGNPAICYNATDFCRQNVEGAYYAYSGRSPYDIRLAENASVPPGQDYMVEYLNSASTQEALGVNLNYTSFLTPLMRDAFTETGDYVFPDFQQDLEDIIDRGVAVSLLYGDADYICNWVAGEAMSLALEHKTTQEFRQSNYTSFVVDGERFGDVRQYGNLSFVRLFNAGHTTPYYQPKASLEHFSRVINGLIIADGSGPVTEDYQTTGAPYSTFTEPFPVLFYQDGNTSIPIPR